MEIQFNPYIVKGPQVLFLLLTVVRFWRVNTPGKPTLPSQVALWKSQLGHRIIISPPPRSFLIMPLMSLRTVNKLCKLFNSRSFNPLTVTGILVHFSLTEFLNFLTFVQHISFCNEFLGQLKQKYSLSAAVMLFLLVVKSIKFCSHILFT